MSSNRYQIKTQEFQKVNAKLLYISMSKYQGDWNSIPHTHNFAELFYVVSGKGTFYLDEETYPIGASDLMIVPPHTEHTEQSYDSNPLEYIVLGIEGITFLEQENSRGRVIYNYSQKAEMLYLLKLIVKEVQEEQNGCHLVCQYLLDVLLIQIMRLQKFVPAPISSVKMTKECGQIKRYLDANYAELITLDTLSEMTHMNKYYLVHAFAKYTGLSPINYLNSKRLEVSKELLVSTNYSISQIASSIGFSSQSYFSQVFRKSTAMTPNEYRKTNADNLTKA
ncbi:MAG: AraC family transcriptional regulator [Hungatella sp.]